MDIAPRYDGQWNIWTRHLMEAASAWQVVHVAHSQREALNWVRHNGRNPKWYGSHE
jgi:uncharacterized protein YbdZ (MbtH family)